MKHIILVSLLVHNIVLFAHGFGANTPVHLDDGSRVAIEQLCRRIEHRSVHVAVHNY